MLPPPGQTAIHGDLAHFSLQTLLSMLELERRDGILEVVSDARTAKLTLRGGRVTRASMLGKPMRGHDAVQIALTWHHGRFSFAATSTTARGWAPRLNVRTGG